MQREDDALKPAIPDHIRRLEPYQPGRPIEEVQRELGLQSVIKLASNENPLGPPPKALEALRAALAEVHRYPDGSGTLLRRALAARFGVRASQILLGNGSNELIDLLARTFVEPDDEIVFSQDAFIIYPMTARLCRARPVPTASVEFRHDLDAMAARVGQRTRIVFLANPNNPTGTIFTRQEFERFLDKVPPHVLVVVDQAYREFVEDPDYPDASRYLDAHPGLVVLGTFSKAYGLAGLRIGYAIGPEPIIDALARVRAPFSVNRLAQAAALAALEDSEYIERSRRIVIEGRRYLRARLAELGLRVVPSQANFVLVDVGDGSRVAQALLAEGVIVRAMGVYGLPSMIRITCGTPEENRRCVEVLERVIAGKP